MDDPLEEKGVYTLIAEIERLIADCDTRVQRIKDRLDRLMREHQNFYEDHKPTNIGDEK
jgi:hypothetical protein